MNREMKDRNEIKKEKKKRKAAATVICFLIFAMASCTTFPGKYRSVQEKEIKNGKFRSVAELKTSDSESGRSVLVSSFLPAIQFYGEKIENNDGFVFYITSAKFFANWPNGWSEAEYQASGKLEFTKNGAGWICRVADTFELWNLEAGRIRYYDTFYRHDDGLIRMKNRIDRITETVRIVKEMNSRHFYGSVKKKIGKQESFRTDMTRILFPEKAGFSKLEEQNLLVKEFYKNSSKFPKERVLGTDYYWRGDYTRAVFPEHIHALRDSGTLWKDFEEAMDIFYSLYNLEYFFTKALDNNSFVKIK